MTASGKYIHIIFSFLLIRDTNYFWDATAGITSFSVPPCVIRAGSFLQSAILNRCDIGSTCNVWFRGEKKGVGGAGRRPST
jgi:hypothetical protein